MTRGRRAAFGITAGLVLTLAVLWPRADLAAPAMTRILLDRHGTFLAQSGGSDATGYGYWPVERVPERVAAAIIAIEDRRFTAHPGVDPVATVRAAAERLRGAGRSGASTIAMQVARMQMPGPRTLPRKLLEAATAMIMVARHGREEVLRHYLRLVPFGNGSHGIAHAARWYLDKPVDDLSWAEIAFLSAIPQAPARMNPYTSEGKARAVRRGHRILAHLHQAGLMGAEEFALAESQIEHLVVPRHGRRPAEMIHPVLRLQRALAASPSPVAPLVFTTLDLAVQRRVQEAASRLMPDWRARGAEQVAVVVMDRSSREVLAWLGSESYFSPQGGAIDFTAVSRSPGSALKPLIYALALDRGRIAANTILADLPETQWGIDNSDHDYLGPMLPRQALANSRNVPAVSVLRQAGLDETHLFLSTLGVHDNTQAASRYGLVLAVGAMPTTLERLIRAYGAIADDGRLKDLSWWRGQEVSPPGQVLAAATARQITLFLSDPAARLPTFPRLGANEAGIPIAIKTGTSQGYRDAWAVTWTIDTMVGVWTGRARGTTMQAMTGAQSSARLAQEILVGLREARPDSLAERAFPPPANYRPVELCARTGLRSAGRCSQTLVEWFADGRPPEEDDVFQLLKVDLRNGLLAAPWTPGDYVVERTFAAFPPEHAAWGSANALAPPPTELSPLDRPSDRAPTAARPGAVGTRDAGAGLRVIAPRDGLRMARNPETPPEADMLNLRATVGRGVTTVVWLVDGRPWAEAGAHDPVHWPLSAGTHVFQVTSQDGTQRSAPVAISVE
ncbi:Multimodular transpeptidase-transglycosylase [Paramagnetospirillum magnetotacticum MS-1]|uniref:peptidoglycan glycosyltransferase n=1 Tax=Paramagnetospirillum magnetotacticum MS-1 TaxID=272627 RepID=A0A0C2YKM2_PARME|nr:transglycosylase domain-containing protein [Paramagnetospirillum magnetotacticum]KIM00345.1 Multimodular transpeptidase-transglycosylase [Paramagnetospirillum magnetotacticum MS-1]